MKKGKAVRFNKIVYVHKHPPIPLVDKEDRNVTEPAMKTGGKVIKPAKYKRNSNVTLPAMHKDDKVTLPAMHTDYVNVTELAMYKDGNVTLPAMHIEDGDVTKPAMHTEDSDVTGPAAPTGDGDVTGPAAPTGDGDVTGPAAPTGDGNMTEVSVDLANTTVVTAVESVEGSNPVWVRKGLSYNIMSHYQATNKFTPFFAECDYAIKNIEWLTHGEFTPEKCRKQIEEFVRVSLLTAPPWCTRARNNKKVLL